MARYNIGDIVKLKMLEGDNHYYMVTDFVDFSVKGEEELSIYDIGDKKLDVDYEIVLIYPVEENPQIENTVHQELRRVAQFKSREYDIIIDYMVRERSRVGYPIIPKNIKHVVGHKSDVKKVKMPKTTKKFGIAEINDILESDATDNKIKEFVEKMDKQLDFLNEAIKNKDEENIKLHKSNLEEIRQTLMELEYFPFKHNRR